MAQSECPTALPHVVVVASTNIGNNQKLIPVDFNKGT